MVRKQYGTTWWGKKWLDSLTGIDYANRIPRGLSYARNDRVLDVQIDTPNSKIHAIVAGSYYSQYSIDLSFKRVPEARKKLFLDAALADLAIVTQLTNRQLDPKLYELAQEHDILLFPRQWSDLGMHCSCPDWAVPCKHIAAVIYKLSELIDANPFLIFELVGIDLTAELKKRNILDDMTSEVQTNEFGELYHHALCRPHEVAQAAAQYDFDLELAPISAHDAQVLYLAPDLVTYEAGEVPFLGGLNAELKKFKRKCDAIKLKIKQLEFDHQQLTEYCTSNRARYEDQLALASKAHSLRTKGTPKSTAQLFVEQYEGKQSELAQVEEDLAAKRKQLDDLEQHYQELQAQNQVDAATLSTIDAELILGYNPEDLPKTEPAAAEETPKVSAEAWSELDAIDAGDDVVPADEQGSATVATAAAESAAVKKAEPAAEGEAPAPKKRGRKTKAKAEAADEAKTAAKEAAPAAEGAGLAVNEILALHQNYIGSMQTQVQEWEAAKAKSHSKKRASAAAEQVEKFQGRIDCAQAHLNLLQQALTTLQLEHGAALDVRRYRGGIEALARLSYTPIEDIGDSIRNMFAESAPGFTQGNLRNRVFHTVEFAAKLAAKQLKDTSDRDMVAFDFDHTMRTYEPSANWATRGQEPELPAGASARAKRGRKVSAETSAAAQLAAEAAQAKELSEQMARAQERYQMFEEYGHRSECCANFSRTALSDHGFYAHPPLFYLGQGGILEVNVPMHVVTTNHLGAPQPNSLIVLPPLHQPTSYHFVGLYQMFSGFIKNTKVLLKERAEVQILYYLWFIASQLVKSRAIMPQLLVNGQNELSCRWIPATASTEVKDLVTQVGLALQGYEHFLFYRRDRQYYLQPQFLGELALAPFIQSYVSWSYALDPKGAQSGDIRELEVLLGAEGVSLDAEDIDAQGLCMRLETWIAPLSHHIGTYTPVLRFIDLSDPANYAHTIFYDLEPEIVAKARAAVNKMQQRLDKFERMAPSLDFLKQIKGAEPEDDSIAACVVDDDDFKGDYDDDYSEGGGSSILGYDDYESFFANNRGIGIELGFVGFSQDLLATLRLAENQGAILEGKSKPFPVESKAESKAKAAAKAAAKAKSQAVDAGDDDWEDDLDDTNPDVPAEPDTGVDYHDSEQQVVGGMDETGFVSLCQIISNPAFEPVRQECLRTVAQLTTLSENLKEILSNEHNVAIVPLTELYDLINTAQTALRLMGVRLVLPKSLTKLPSPKTVMELEVNEDEQGEFQKAKSFLSLDAMLHFNWRVAVGDDALTLSEFKLLLANAGNIVRFRDRFVYADPDLLISIQHKFERMQDGATPQTDLLAAMLTGNYEGTPVLLSSNVKDKLEDMLKEEPIALPEGLNATLRPYQVRGFEWLMRNSRINVGSILADDMGLGKTLQVITTLLKLKQEGVVSPEKPALIVVPTSLVTNWQREVQSFAPSLSLHAYYGLVKDFGYGTSDLIITTYGTARTRLKTLQEHKFSVLVIDEAQAIKTISTSISKSMRSINADYRIAMSGTPVENRLLEYYSILDFANRGLFGTPKTFHKNFAKPIEENHDSDAVARFKRLTAPFIMRRLKSDKAIIADLPDKLTSDQFCNLTEQQAAIYQALVNEAMKQIELYREDPNMRRASILKLIQQLKAICNSPAQFDASGKYRPEDSGKVERLFELLEDISEANGKALIFTQSVVMGKILQNLIEERFERKPDFLHGSLSRNERMDMVDNFQNDPSNRFLLLSLKAAGTGLNLTAANNVIHFDLWWNPAVENQATDRAYRIGQRNKVQVYRFICANTFEERINDMIRSKSDLAELTVSAGESWLGKLSDRQLNDLFTLHQDSK